MLPCLGTKFSLISSTLYPLEVLCGRGQRLFRELRFFPHQRREDFAKPRSQLGFSFQDSILAYDHTQRILVHIDQE